MLGQVSSANVRIGQVMPVMSCYFMLEQDWSDEDMLGHFRSCLFRLGPVRSGNIGCFKIGQVM
jgi:hypothetical protein